MGEPKRKTVKIQDRGRTLAMSPEELVGYVASLSRTHQDELIHLSGPIDAIYQNEEGKLTREGLSLQQVVRRIRTGEQPVITGARDPKLDLKRKQDQATIRDQIADDSNIAAMRQAIDPWRLTGLPQKLENKLVGKAVADEARSRLADENPLLHFAGPLASGLGISTGVKAGARAIGMAAAKGSTKAMLGGLLADEIAVNTAFYVTDTLNRGKPFVAEDLGKQIVGGLLVTSPAFLGLAVRRPLAQVLKKGAPGAAGIASKGADLMVAGGLVGASKWRQKLFKTAAATRVGGRFLRRSKQKIVGAADEVAEFRKQVAQDAKEIDKLRVGVRPRDVESLLDAVGTYLDDAKQLRRLERVDYASVKSRVIALRAAAENVRKQGSKFENLGNPRLKKAPEFTKEGLREWSRQAGAIYDRVEDFGWANELNYLERAAKTKNPARTYGLFARARMLAAIRAGKGGAAEVNQLMREFLEDGAVWGGELAGKGRKINKALDDISRAYEDMDNLRNVFNDLDEIVEEHTLVKSINDSAETLRSGYAELERMGVISRSAAANVERVLGEVNNATKNAVKPLSDLTAMNRARKTAAQAWTKLDDSSFLTAEKMYAERAASIEASQVRVERWTENLRNFITKGDKATYVATRIGVNAMTSFYALSEAEKRDMFNTFSETVTSFTGSPFAFEEALGDFLAPYSQEDPELAEMSGMAAGNSIYWLRGQIPRTDRSVYGRNLVSRSKRDEFLEKCVACIDPMSVPEMALLGRVNKGMIDAMRVTSPELYAEIGGIASEFIDSADLMEVPRRIQNGLNLLLGGIDPLYTGPALLELQSNYAQTPMQQQVIGGATPSSDMNPQKPGNNFTFAQRLASY